ncbi:MAG: 3-phosphoshikimate 1-carboxyvinyltransferase [Acidimicrobiales bacterium]
MTLPDVVLVGGGTPLRGRLRAPGDKSISHRALLVGALAEGTSTVTGLSDGDDVGRTRVAVEALGAAVSDGPAGRVLVEGGRPRLHAADAPVDCGNSGTGMRLLAGVVAGLPFTTVLVGDESLSRRPMDRVAEPLRRMGADVAGRGERCLPPLRVVGGRLRGVEWSPPVASAQVKSAVLLAGLSASSPTVVHEPVATRSHTEELLALAGADIEVVDEGTGRTVRLGPSRLRPFELTVPGDPSQAAFWVVAACLVPGSEVTVTGVYGGPARRGFLDVLRRMGARVAVRPAGEGTVDVVAGASALRATTVTAPEIPSLDEVPILAVAAAAAEGVTVFTGMGELRVKESDRLTAVAALVRSLGAGAEVEGDDLRVTGVGPDGRLVHAATTSGGDHRMAMAAAVAALAAGDGHSEVGGFSVVATSYPGFLDDLRALGATAAAPDCDDPDRDHPDDPDHRVGAGRLVGADPLAGAAVPGLAAGAVVAIDGPAGSGKSTVSRAVAARLGVPRLDTGAMYRSVAWAALERGVDPADTAAVAAIAEGAEIEVGPERVRIDGTDVTEAIRRPAVSRAVSVVAANPAVRRALVARQRRWRDEHGGGVVEGRDIGSVVFPDAVLKVYLTASPEERARRRQDEPAAGVARRDHLDTTRAASPLQQAADARLLDTTGRSVEDVVEEVLSWL